MDDVICSNTPQLEPIKPSEASQKERDKHHMVPIQMQNLKSEEMTLSVKRKQNPRHRQQPSGCQGRAWEGCSGGLGSAGVSFYTGWINSPTVAIAHGTIFNILRQTIMVKKVNKDAHICITELLCYTTVTDTTF